MTDYNWSGWAATAAKSGGGPTLEPDSYTAEVVDAGAKPSRNGQPNLWFRFKILVGPSAGETETLFQNLNPENPKALAAFYGVLGRLGVDFSKVPDGTPPEAIAKTVIGRRFTFDFAHREDEKTKKVYSQFNNLVQLDAAVQAPVAVPAAVVAAVVEAAVVPVVEALTPAPDSIEAQIAALQAQQAAAAAPAAEAVAAVPAKGKLPF